MVAGLSTKVQAAVCKVIADNAKAKVRRQKTEPGWGG